MSNQYDIEGAEANEVINDYLLTCLLEKRRKEVTLKRNEAKEKLANINYYVSDEDLDALLNEFVTFLENDCECVVIVDQ